MKKTMINNKKVDINIRNARENFEVVLKIDKFA